MSSFDAVIMTRGLLEFCLVCSVQALKCALLSTVLSVLKCARHSAQYRAQCSFVFRLGPVLSVLKYKLSFKCLYSLC